MIATSLFSEAFAEADGFRVRYLEAGSGPALVHIHSAGGLRTSRAHELLAAGHHVYALEVPGFGAHEKNDRSQSLADLGATIASVAGALGLERFNLWGTSFGGAVALWTAIACPEAIDALVLEGPGAIPPEGGFPAPQSREEFHALLYAHPERHPMSPPLDPSLLEQRRGLLSRLLSVPREETERRLTEVRVPTLVIFGTRDRITPPELGRIYREKMPDCNLVLLYDVAHEAAAERPEAFSSLVTDFLERRSAFIVNQKSAQLYP